MEISDNQHPIDLSRKCNYCEQPCKSITQRPLPDLIPISVLTATIQEAQKRENLYFNKFVVASNADHQFKEQSKTRKELSRFKSVPMLSKSTKMSRLKSKSDSKIPFVADATRHVPILENEHFNGKYYSSFSNPSPFEKYSWKPLNDEVSVCMSRRYMKQGPGVSMTTIESLRKMLDKRKSLHQE